MAMRIRMRGWVFAEILNPKKPIFFSLHILQSVIMATFKSVEENTIICENKKKGREQDKIKLFYTLKPIVIRPVVGRCFQHFLLPYDPFSYVPTHIRPPHSLSTAGSRLSLPRFLVPTITTTTIA